MRDQWGRKIEYLRISVTDRCNLRCRYCMPPAGIELFSHEDILNYGEIVRITSLLSELGIKKVRLTGGEPLVRRDIHLLVEAIKEIPGIEKLMMTTNGVDLKSKLPKLMEAGLDGVNISIDTINEATFKEITGRTGLHDVLEGIQSAKEAGLEVKLNCVLSDMNREDAFELIDYFCYEQDLTLRFIQWMPMGQDHRGQGLTEKELRSFIEKNYGEIRSLSSGKNAGPAQYMTAKHLKGKVGFISALSNCFCQDCNRIRLTSTGFLKTCLQYNHGLDLRKILEAPDEMIKEEILKTVYNKPEGHNFHHVNELKNRDKHGMSQIGG